MSTILIVDDDEEGRSLMRVILEAEGHDTIEAANTEEALRLLDLKPEAIFVAVESSARGGVPFVLALRQHATLALTPATFITAHPERVAFFGTLGIAEKHVVSKPFQRTDIRNALARMLGSLKRRNLRVSLHPGDLSVAVDGSIHITVVRLSTREIYVRGGPHLAVGSAHTLLLRSGSVEIPCRARVANRVRGETRFALSPDERTDKAISELMAHLLLDHQAHENVRGAERVMLTASVTWERAGSGEVGYLRDLSASGCYVVSNTLPPKGESVMVYLPWKEREGMQIRGAEAQVVRHGSDGFGCMFSGENVHFFVAVNALMSDGTVVSGEGRPT